MLSSRNLVDCLIAGGGYVGLSVAVAIKVSAPHLNVTLVDAAPQNAISHDERASAVAAAASRMLDQLGVWQELLQEAQPITEMIVTDSRTSDPVRPVFLTFGDIAQNKEETPFAHMVPNKVMISALREKARKLGVRLMHETQVKGFETQDVSTLVSFDSGELMATRLLIAADGVRSGLRESAGIKTVEWPYNQMGIVTTVAHERPHEGRAEEHFLPGGPFGSARRSN